MASIDVLKVSPALVCDLIARTMEFQSKEEVTIPEQAAESEYEYDWAAVLADHHDDLTYQEIHNVITSLTEEQRVDILTLLYIGRGDADGWHDARILAYENMPSYFTEYLLAHPFIADYLIKALESLGYSYEL